MMQYIPTTAKGIERLKRFFRTLLPAIGSNLFPTRLRHQLAQYSMEAFQMDLGYELVSLEIGGNQQNQRCLHVWLTNPAVAVERLAQSAIMAGKFLSSQEVSNHESEVLFGSRK